MKMLISSLSALLCGFILIGAMAADASDMRGRGNSKSEVVITEATDIGLQLSQITQYSEITLNTQSTEDANIIELSDNISYAIIALTIVFLIRRMIKIRSNRQKKANQNDNYYQRRLSSPDEEVGDRDDYVDYPSGFGGLGNRKAIYLEDMDEADDIGIIKRDERNPAEEQDGKNR